MNPFMKTIHKQLAVALGAFLVCCGLITLFVPQTHAQNASSRQPSAIIVQLTGTYNPPLNQPAPQGRVQSGMELQWSSPSANATVLPNGTSAGDTYAYYIGQGYSFQALPGDRVLFWKEK